MEWLELRTLLANFNPWASAPDDAGNSHSLRAAIIAANNSGGDDVITLQKGVYKLSITNSNGQENQAYEGDLDLTQSGRKVTIQGAGAGKSIIDAACIDRIFQIFEGVTVIFKNVTLRNGLAQDDGSEGAYPGDTFAYGGGILSNGCVTLQNVVIECCTALGADGDVAGASGAGVRGGGIYSDGPTLKIVSSTLQNNKALGGNGVAGDDGDSDSPDGQQGGAGGSAFGGGLYSEGTTVCISKSNIVCNLAHAGCAADGGDSDSESGNGGDGNLGGDAFGGGIYVRGPLFDLTAKTISSSTVFSIDNSNVSQNAAIAGDGSNGGDSTNANGGAAGGGGDARGGGLYSLLQVCATNCCFVGNIAHAGDGGDGGDGTENSDTGGMGGHGGVAEGGGIFALAGLTITSSTVCSNLACAGDGGQGGSAKDAGGKGGDGGSAAGGGVWASAPVTVSCTDISRNSALGGRGGDGGEGFVLGGDGGAGGDGQGGGIYVNLNLNPFLTVNTAPVQLVTYAVSVKNGSKVNQNTARGGDGGDGGAGEITTDGLVRAPAMARGAAFTLPPTSSPFPHSPRLPNLPNPKRRLLRQFRRRW